MATTTLDTRFGLSGREGKKKEPVANSEIMIEFLSFPRRVLRPRAVLWVNYERAKPRRPLRPRRRRTPLRGDDCDVVPLLLLAVQLHHRADGARVRGDAEQSLGVRLGIDGVPVTHTQRRSGGGVKESRRGQVCGENELATA